MVALDAGHTSLLIPLQSSPQSVVSTFALDPLNSGSISALRSRPCFDTATLLLGMACFDSVSLPSASAVASLNISILTKSLSRLFLVMLASDLLHSGLTLFIQSRSQFGFAAASSGLARFDFLFFLSIMELTHLGASLPPRNLTCSGLVSSVLDFTHLGLSMTIRSSWCSSALSSLLGCAWCGPFLLASNSVYLKVLPAPRSFGHLKAATFTLDFLHPGLLLPSKVPL